MHLLTYSGIFGKVIISVSQEQLLYCLIEKVYNAVDLYTVTVIFILQEHLPTPVRFLGSSVLGPVQLS